MKRYTIDTLIGVAACVAFAIHTKLYVGAVFLWIAIHFAVRGHQTESQKLIELLKALKRKRGL